jgi:hypothetical protein
MHICTADLPGVKADAPARSDMQVTAAEERVDNTRVTTIQGLFVQRAVLDRNKLWQKGRTIRIKFIDGDPTVQAKVRQIADEWLEVVNLDFEWVTPQEPAEIRISFADKGASWSYIGTDNLATGGTIATMNYGWLDPSTDITEYRRVVRHEFGHMIGMHHEQSSPLAAIPWDKAKLYAYYQARGWSKADVDWNVLYKLPAHEVYNSAYDPASIMHYPVPEELTIGNFSIGWNVDLSAHDREFMATMYPHDKPAEIALHINGDRVIGELTPGETDTYTLTVAQADTFIITTAGALDTTLTVHGPGDPGLVAVFDEDRGQAYNARVVKKLYPGLYWVTVRHGLDNRPGPYTIGVKTRKR